MIKSAAIQKVKTLAKWKESRLQKKRLKKAETEARLDGKKYFPSSINAVIEAPVELTDDAPPTREELESKAAELGIVMNKRTSNKKLLSLIEAELASVAGD
jgi:FMN phosphatase YigB (HAD superfamily)